MIGACTIVSPNFLAYARTLCASYLEQHPTHRFFVLIVADLSLADLAKFEGFDFTPVALGEIGLEDIKSLGMRYDILELNTNVKPSFMKHLIRTFDLDILVYLDPDIFVYSPLSPVFDALNTASAVLTPHLTSPMNDGKFPSEQEMLYNGTYNLGFIGIRPCDESGRILDWWEKRCLELGFSEGRTGLFVDQKWMNLAPGMFPGLAIIRHAGCNMAYWNLHERRLSIDSADRYVVNDDAALCFFHFSGIVLDDPGMLSKNTDRFKLIERPDLQEIFSSFKLAVLLNRDAEREGIPYGFDRLTDGTAVTRLARRIYSKHQTRWAGDNPFDSEGEFALFANRVGLLAGKTAAAKATWSDFDAQDGRVKMIHRVLKIVLRLLGPNRYELAMRYLAHIAVLRNQSVFLDD